MLGFVSMQLSLSSNNYPKNYLESGYLLILWRSYIIWLCSTASLVSRILSDSCNSKSEKYDCKKTIIISAEWLFQRFAKTHLKNRLKCKNILFLTKF